jgi:uroporphyrinogen decarboxylase
MMRQAGRYLPEYRAVREKASFLDLCYQPELAIEVTLQPIRRYDFDAAIIFSDILVPLIPMGANFSFGGGPPRLDEPFDNPKALARLKKVDVVRDIPWIHQALGGMREALAPDKALLGFAGAPFTLFCYLVEGQGSKHFERAKKLMWTEPKLAEEILELLAETIGEYLVAQLEHGADAVQLFDTWGGLLHPQDFERFALPYARKVFDRVGRSGAPSIYYLNGNPALLAAQAAAGCTAVGVDWRVRLSQVRQELPEDIVIQGNLDPILLLTDPQTVRRRTRAMLDEMVGRPGYIVNLGHGVTPPTPLECVDAFVETVRESGKGPTAADSATPEKESTA